MSHYRQICPHGQLVGQCRCPSPEKVTEIVPCPFPEHEAQEIRINPDGTIPYVGESSDFQVQTGDIARADQVDRATEFMKQVSPIKHEPLATLVAREWAEKLIAEGWRLTDG